MKNPEATSGVGGRAVIAGYDVRLDAWFRRDGRAWLAWCPTIDVMTQASRKETAFASLEEAVQLWFESCIERGVLAEALHESGFSVRTPGEDSPRRSNFVHVRYVAAEAPAAALRFSVGHRRGSDYIEGVIPANLAESQLGTMARASH